jgi:hypothetical protein
MDMHEIMSTVRDLTGLSNEGDIGTSLMKRYTNMSQDRVSQMLLTLMDEWLVKTITGTGIATQEVALPGDVLQIMDCSRDGTPCERVPVQDKLMIGRSANHPGTSEFPAWTHEGAKAIFTPAFAGSPGTAYQIRYRKRLVPMIEGTMTYGSSSTITLSADAQPIDDIYNDYQLTLYLNTAGVKSAPQVFRITDYVGSTKVATVFPASVVNQTTYGALWPLIPAEYHNILVNTTMWFLAKAGKYKGANPDEIMKTVREDIAAELSITVPVRDRMKQE